MLQKYSEEACTCSKQTGGFDQQRSLKPMPCTHCLLTWQTSVSNLRLRLVVSLLKYESFWQFTSMSKLSNTGSGADVVWLVRGNFILAVSAGQLITRSVALSGDTGDVRPSGARLHNGVMIWRVFIYGKARQTVLYYTLDNIWSTV